MLFRSRYNFPVLHHGTLCSSTLFINKNPDIIIDFSTPPVSDLVYNDIACYYHIPMVCATTKLPVDLIELMKHQTIIPVFQAFNMSYDVYKFTQTVAMLVKMLPCCDIDIREVHHTGKKDAPSGTALNLASAINTALKEEYTIVCNPVLDGLRRPNEIHIHSERRGAYAGTHIVTLTAANKYTITLSHEAFSPQIFVDGAIKAAEFLLTQPVGYYSMENL